MPICYTPPPSSGTASCTESLTKSESGNDKKTPKVRNSNLELYRIIVMLLIVAHHYVVNSGLFEKIQEIPLAASSAMMLLFGAWGKTGINCFVLITGYFMCKSEFTWQKLLRLYLQIALYSVIIYGIFCMSGHESFSAFEMAFVLFPVKSVADDFVSSFMVFFLLIPFLNILLRNIDKSQHLALLILLLTVYTLLPSVGIRIQFNYMSWFSVIYFMAAYIRFYGGKWKISHKSWGWITILLILVSSICVLGLFGIYKFGYTSHWKPYFLLADSNKILAVAVSVSSFMWFKDLKIRYSRLINLVGATTFGVLLIHANSEAMRQWLWRETVMPETHLNASVLYTLGYAIVSVLVIFVACSGIDWFRGKLIEPRLLKGCEALADRIKSKLSQDRKLT